MNFQVEERKLKERTSLLMRFFWLDFIYKIGKELKLHYFESFPNYWEINHYQAALEVARSITDEDLVRIVNENSPKYGLNLGGFHGKFYTATETGELELESSWDLIRNNTRKALEKWEDKTYGILQALINKNGRATYFDLIDEIEKVLGYEFIPSYLLPRFGSLNLVFKTGSNKYPDWTMPSEIIPVIQEELRNFRRPFHPRKAKVTPSERVLRIEREIGTLADKIVEARCNIDLLFEKKFGTKLFKQNERAINDIRKPCSNEEEFNNRIMNLALLINDVETDKVAALIKSKKPEPGSINLIEAFLNEAIPNFNKTVITNLRMIITLRSKKHPIHRPDPTLLSAFNYFGFTSLSPDWQDLWDAALRRYLDSLDGLISTIVSMS